MEKSEQINELAAALAKAQSAIRDAKKDSRNPMFNSYYADLSAIWDACRKPLSDNNLAVIQTTHCEDNGEKGPMSYLETMLVHSSGQWISGTYYLRPMQQKKGEGWQDNPNPQAMASALTYRS
jgi:hypothetical protein